ncbi:MAG: hypothetical protein ABSC62_13195 [Terracidiphilus sp.]|jgi:hypothetical protein
MRITRIFSLFVTLTILAWSSLAHSTCTTSVSSGTCGPYSDSSITESNGSNTYVEQDVWGGVTWSQTLTETTPSSWYVSANIAASTSRVSYPYTYQVFNSEAVSSFTNIVGTFNETSDHSSSTEEQVGFDIYLNSWGNEIQIQHDMVNTPQCGNTTPVKTGIQFGGSYGVPVLSWDLCHNGLYYWQLPKGSSNTYGESSGSVDLIAMIKYLETNGYLPSSSTMTEVSYGFIIDTTSATTKTFTLSSYSLINNASSGSPTISLSPTSLSFSATQGGANPSAQNVTVSNSGGGTLAAPTTQINYSQGSGWLSVNCTGSQAPYTCSTQPTTGSLSSGTYNATVQVSSSGATNSPQNYTVAFTVNPVSSPTISLSPTSLTFNATVGGGNPSSQNVTVSNSGGGTLAVPTTGIVYHSGSGWLSVQVQGSQAPYTLVTQPTTGSLAAGTYTATVNVSSSGATNSPQPYTVSFTLTSGSVCTVTTTTGTCGPYNYPQITANGTYPIITEQDVWNPPSSWSQTLYSTSPGNWYVTANYPTDGSGAIHTYPSTRFDQLDAVTLDSYSYMYSSFSVSPDTSSTTVSDIGYDLWLNNWGNEVMIQHQLINIPNCTTFATHVPATNVQFGGSYGVPTNTWNLCQFGNEGSGSVELIWEITGASGSKNFGFSSGSVDMYAMLKWLENSTACYSSSGSGSACLKASSTMTSTEYGFEISSTGGLSKNFTVNNFTVTSSKP